MAITGQQDIRWQSMCRVQIGVQAFRPDSSGAPENWAPGGKEF